MVSRRVSIHWLNCCPDAEFRVPADATVLLLWMDASSQ
jgi:hypothetical protein